MQFLQFFQSLTVLDANRGRAHCVAAPHLRAYEEIRSVRDIVIKRRQSFFNIFELARDVWTAVETPGSRIVVLCADDDAIVNPRQQVMDFIESANLRCSSSESNTIRLPNSSEVRFMAADNRRKLGKSGLIHRLHVAEAAFFGKEADAFVMARFECVPPQGEIVIESSLRKDGIFRPGFFFELYKIALTEDSAWKVHVFGGAVPCLRTTSDRLINEG